MLNRNIILIGFMGSGKTSLGIKLSYRFQTAVEDTDKIIESREGRKITKIFATDGEGVFREMETALLKELSLVKNPKIYSLGGGTPIQPQNRELVKEAGFVVFLRIKPETVYERLKGDTTRPLLNCDDPKAKIEELLEYRNPFYEACADYIVDVDDKNQQDITNLIVDAACKAGAYSEGKRGGKDKMRKLLVINGPNLNFLGIREKAVYGNQDYEFLKGMIADKAKACNCEIEVFQSNHEGAIIDRIQEAYFDGTEGIVINPGAYTHYSYAIHDALASIEKLPKVEIHISDITKREDFRKVSVTAPACDKQIYGQGLDGYLQAIDFVLAKL